MKEPVWYDFYEPGVKKVLEIQEIGLYEMFEKSVVTYGHRPALIFSGRTWTYLEMYREVEKLANALVKVGTQAGDRISINMPNSANWVISFFAIMKLGGIVVQTNPLYVESELKALLNDSGARGMITVAPLYPRVQAIRQDTALEWVVAEGLAAYGIPEGVGTYDFHSLISDPSIQDVLQTGWTEPTIRPRLDAAVLQYTGGTTGVSKGVKLSHTNLFANALQIWEWVQGEEGQEKILCVLPLFHIYALTVCMNLAILSGSALVLVSKFDRDLVLQHINDDCPTLFPGAPTMYIALINHPRIKEYNLSSIRACVSGSAPLPVEVALRFGELTGGRLVEGYGLSESSPVTHVNPLNRFRVGSIGIPISNTKAKIVDIDTGEKILSPGEVGELVVSGPQVMIGYWDKVSETHAVLRDGWLYTGDLARMDEDGYFYIVDRKKDMIITGGYNVYPREIEEVLYKHPAIKEAVCAGIPDSYWGEMVKAYVVFKEEQQVTVDALYEYIKKELASYKIPKQIEIRDNLPRTAVGKVLRRFLVEEEKQRINLVQDSQLEKKA